MQTPIDSSSRWFGLTLGLGVGISISILGVFLNLAKEHHSFADVLFFRMFWSALFLLPFIYRDLPIVFSRRSLYLWLRAIFGACSALCYFYVLSSTSLALANLIANLSPLWVLAIGHFMFKESIGSSKVFVAVLVIGAILSLNIGGNGSIENHVALVGIVGSMFAAFAMVSLRQASQQQSVALIVFLMSLVTALVALVFSKQPFNTLVTFDDSYLWGVVFSSLIYQSSMTYQYRFLPASIAIILNESAIVWSMACDALFFARYPSPLESVVAGVVIFGILFIQDIPKKIYHSLFK